MHRDQPLELLAEALELADHADPRARRRRVSRPAVLEDDLLGSQALLGEALLDLLARRDDDLDEEARFRKLRLGDRRSSRSTPPLSCQGSGKHPAIPLFDTAGEPKRYLRVSIAAGRTPVSYERGR